MYKFIYLYKKSLYVGPNIIYYMLCLVHIVYIL